METMNISSAQYMKMKDEITCIKIIVGNETFFVPFDFDNTHYAEIMRQVEAGELTIQEADQ